MKLWGGRFSEGLHTSAAALNNSIAFDWRLAEVDILGSLAWVKALAQANVLTTQEAAEIRTGLEQVHEEVRSGQFTPAPSDEDVHTAIERRLTERIGLVGGKLHTGRSRNDQVATDFRLWLMDKLQSLDSLLIEVHSALLERAESDLGIIMPGYTHLQRAQPILLSHWWLSHLWPLVRDRERFSQVRARTAVMPLGAGALAGTAFPIDRVALAQDLGFDVVSPNSLDAVSDRDFAAEFLFAAALLGIHLSRFAEMLILFSTAEFGFIELSDAFSTGSSLMPQKKNPDTLELARGKAGGLVGRLTGLLVTLKGLPSAYDKDLQEDKLAVFETVDTLELLLPVIAGLVQTLTLHPQAMRRALDPALLATDLADYLVEREVPFREAHALVGQVVRRAQVLGISLDQLSQDEYQAISPVFQQDVHKVFDFQASVNRRSVQGGTAIEAVRKQIEQARRKILSEP